MSFAPTLDRAEAGPRTIERRIALPLFAASLFLSALLLFAIQPMFTRMVLPSLGGAPAVWSVAMVFFQGMVLAGYAYAHWLAKSLQPRTAVLVHAAVMASAFLALPITYAATFGAPPQEWTALWLIAVFGASVGLPFFAVAGNGPLLQAWFAKTDHPHARDPYFLYGASNIGSFAALIAYPILIEPVFGLAEQSRMWTLGFVALLAVVVACGLVAARAARPVPAAAAVASTDAGPAPTWQRKATWIGLAFVPSALLVAVSAHISADVAAAPFLWVLPLALFLLTFVVTFQRQPVLKHRWMVIAQPIAIALLVAKQLGGIQFGAPTTIVLNLAAFFVSAMVAHGELVRRRPHASHLTSFYLFMSLGGVLGGIFAALIAPLLFNSVAEYPILLVASLLVRVAIWRRAPPTLARDVAIGALVGAAIIVPRFVMEGESQLRMALVLGALALFLFCSMVWRRSVVRFAAMLALVFVGEMIIGPSTRDSWQVRSFFGVHRVAMSEDGRFRLLFHGTTLHGAMRVLDAEGRPVDRPEPTTYYHPQGPFGDVARVARAERDSLRVGAVGLGTGSVAWYGRAGDAWTFFEIDQTVVDLARDERRFRFLRNLPDARYVLGDARLTLVDVPDGSLDLLFIDAFSSDSIPVHLLTVEALTLYQRKIAPGGRIVLHISNRNLELGSVVAAGAHAANLHVVHREDYGVESVRLNYRAPTHMAVLAPDARSLEPLRAAGWSTLERRAGVAPWTDDYADIPGSMVRHFMEARR